MHKSGQRENVTRWTEIASKPTQVSMCVYICTYTTVVLVCKLTVTHEESVKLGCCTRHTDSVFKYRLIHSNNNSKNNSKCSAGHDIYAAVN